MRRISIERYSYPDQMGYAGLVEGVRDDDTSWIMFLDEHGSPQLFWGERDEGGGVNGDPIVLDVKLRDDWSA